MDPEVIVPIVAMISVFGMPVAIVWLLKHFKLRERELALEEAQAKAGDQKLIALDARLRRLEDAITSIDDELRHRLPAATGPRQLPAEGTPSWGAPQTGTTPKAE